MSTTNINEVSPGDCDWTEDFCECEDIKMSMVSNGVCLMCEKPIKKSGKIIIPARFEKADSIEEIFCLVTLIAAQELPADATLWDSRYYYESKTDSCCENCPFVNRCMASIINE